MNLVLVGGPRIPWNQSANPSSPVSTPATTSVLATQLNMPSGNLPIRHNSPQLQNMPPGSSIVSQAQNMNSVQGKYVLYETLFNESLLLHLVLLLAILSNHPGMPLFCQMADFLFYFLYFLK